MYDYLKGQVTRVTPEYIVLEQQGIEIGRAHV